MDRYSVYTDIKILVSLLTSLILSAGGKFASQWVGPSVVGGRIPIDQERLRLEIFAARDPKMMKYLYYEVLGSSWPLFVFYHPSRDNNAAADALSRLETCNLSTLEISHVRVSKCQPTP